ncbi:unnamed protein product [Rhizoctonia solani]|uniref:Uncharacterized protein n=1 Tax=Rhizoctonia solani TaxID=456999 RepID=A0A8H3CX70_9AGAM|nr:unnamed protein product [Rhizoctonia solani]
MQADNRLLTNLIKCEKEHHSALLGLLVRSHTSLAALSAYASTASPPVAQALRGCIQSFAAADEGLRGYAAAVEGWKEELKEVKRVEDELKAVVKDKDILVGRLIKASKQKIPTSSIQAGPAPIPSASPSSSSLSFSNPTSQPYQYTPTPHATQHINSKLAQAQRELQACEAHLAAKEAELAEVRRSAIAEGMARRCRAMADAGHVWRERGELGLGALHELSGEDAGAAPTQYSHRRSYSTHSTSSSSLAPSHSVSQQRHTHTRSQSPFSPTYSHNSRSTSPAPGTYHSISGGYQHSHPLPALPERNSWHVEDEPSRRPVSLVDPPRRPISLVDPPRAPTLHRRPISSHDLPPLPDQVTLDIPPPHSIGHGTDEFIPLGRSISKSERWEDSSSGSEQGEYRVVENEVGTRWEDEVDPEILRAVEKMGVVTKSRDVTGHTPPTPPDTVSSLSPGRLPDVRVIEATPQKGRTRGKAKKTRRALLEDDTIVLAPTPTTTTTAAAPRPIDKALPALSDKRTTVPVSPTPAPTPAPALVLASPTPTSTSTRSPAPPQPAPKPEPEPAQPRSPISLDLGHGDPRGDDVTRLPKDLNPTTTTRRAQLEESGDRSSESGESDRLSELDTKAAVIETPEAHLDLSVSHASRSHSASTVFDSSTSTPVLLDTPRAPLTVLDTSKTPSPSPLTSTVFETPRAPSSTLELDTPKAVVLSPSPAASESVYATPLVVPSDIPGVPGYDTMPRSPHSPGLENPRSPVERSKSPLAETPRSPLGETPRSPREVPHSPRLEIPTSPRLEAPTGLITPMATGSNPNPKPHPTEPKRRTMSGDETPGRKKTTKKKGHSRQSSAVESTRTRADVAVSEGTAPHVRFPGPSSGGMFVPSAPPPRPQPDALYLPSNGTTRSDVGPVRGHHFEPTLPPPGRNRSGSVNGSTSFFGRVAGLFGRKKQSDGYLSSGGGGQTWRTRTDANISRTGGDDSSEDERQPKNLVAVTNLNPRLVSVENNAPGSPKRAGLGRKLTKAEKSQTLRVEPPESPTRTRKPSITEEHVVPAKNKKSKSRSVDGGGISRKGSLRSNASEPNPDTGRKMGKEPSSLMAIVEGPGLVLPSEFVSRRTDSPAPDPKSQTLAVPPARAVSPTSTAAPRPVRATSPMPLKSALRNRTPSPLPPTRDQPNLVVPASNAPAQSPRNSISESIYETGEEDFDAGSDDDDARSDITASGAQTTTIPTPTPAQPVHSPGAALAAFKDNLQTSTSGGSVSTAGPRSANSAQRKSVRINPAPPQMSATPTATPGSELEEEPAWTVKANSTSTPGWSSRIGRGWEDSSDESDEEYERIRNALATSSKHMEAMNKPIHGRR